MIASETMSHVRGRFGAAPVRPPELRVGDGLTIQFGWLDLGSRLRVALSISETVPTPQHLAQATKTLARSQRAVSFKKRNSNQQRKTKLRVASARVANWRRDFRTSFAAPWCTSSPTLRSRIRTSADWRVLAKSVAVAAWTNCTVGTRQNAPAPS
jgi:hypothetical protein